MGNVRRYEGATISRLTDGWVTASTSADREVQGSLVKLRDRARQLCRDNDYARNAVRLITNNVVGCGIKLQARPSRSRRANANRRMASRIEAEWASWGKARRCDVAGRLSFHQIERLAIRSLAESGEVLIRIVRQQFGDSRIPLALQVIEADQLDHEKHDEIDRDNSRWRMGVRVDVWGRPIEYCVLKGHPGDTFSGSRINQRVNLPAKDVIHLAIVERPGQTRGVPWFASTIKKLHHVDGFEEAEVVRARASSCLMGFIMTPEGELAADEEAYDQRVSNFEPGVFKQLNPGETVQVPDLGAPNEQFETFLRAMLQGMAAGVGISYAALSQDYSRSNYSSARQSLLDDRDHWRALQSYLIEALHERVYEEWLAAAHGVGVLQLPGFESDPDGYAMAHWQPRGWGWVDPAKEVEAARDAVRAGFVSRQQIIAEQGGDPETITAELAEDHETTTQLGLVLETDPAHEVQQTASNMSSINDFDDDSEDSTGAN
jgi:lambda family phage portal protein